MSPRNGGRAPPSRARRSPGARAGPGRGPARAARDRRPAPARPALRARARCSRCGVGLSGGRASLAPRRQRGRAARPLSLESGGLTRLLNQAAEVTSSAPRPLSSTPGCSRCATPRWSRRAVASAGSASVTEADLRTALPVLNSVTPVASAGGRSSLQGTATAVRGDRHRGCHGGPAERGSAGHPQRPLRRAGHGPVVLRSAACRAGCWPHADADGFAVSATGRVR